jgi:hypothetical protein
MKISTSTSTSGPKGTAGKTPPPLGDVAFVYGQDEQGVHLLRRRSEEAPVEAAVVQPLAEGRPISGEVVSLRRRQDLPFLFDVKTELAHQPPHGEAPHTMSAGDGPPQVASDSYRKGWDAVWGPRRRPASRPVN